MKKVLSNAPYILSLLVATFLFSTTQAQVNQLTEKEKKEGWTLLFDGKSLNGWHLYYRGNVPGAWSVKSSELVCDPTNKDHGDLVSDKEFENYDLTFDWKIAKAGNSGVFINVIESKDIPNTWASGPEYQMLETTHKDYSVLNKRSGCIFNFDPQKNPAKLKPQGQWNKGRIKQVNGKIEFYVNGILTAQEDLKSKAWADKVSKSSFAKFPEFGKHTKGHISFQDWYTGVSFRNVKIKQL